MRLCPVTHENVVSKRVNACASLKKRLLTQRDNYIALADTWTQLANMFESDNALAACLGDAGLNVVPLKLRRPIRLRAA
jgi:hypothetical protein